MFPPALMAESLVKVAVIYPESKSVVFTRVFGEIIDGIKLNSELDVVTFMLTGRETKEELVKKLHSENVKLVIALGKKSYLVGHELSSFFSVVHGGVMIEPNGHSGISLVTDPEVFFTHLVNLAPSVKRVYTVYSEKSNGWLIRMAREVAKKYNIELHALEAKSLREGMFKLRQVLSEVEDANDAVWLLLDRTVPDKTALPIVLEKAWDSRVVVFSNNPSHTRRGALFALFPNHSGMGIRLGQLALSQGTKGALPLVLPSQNLKVSVNERTASHLGFALNQNQLAAFDLIYPRQ